MASTTSRIAAPYPVGTDPTNVPGDVQALAARLDLIVVAFVEGTAATFGATSAGEHGRVFYITDTKRMYWDTGSAWVLIGGVDNLVTAKGDLLVATAAGALAKVTVGSNGQRPIADSTQTAGIRWGTVTYRHAHTWAVSGTLAVQSGSLNYIPPFYVPVPTGQAVTIAAVRAKVRAGTVTLALTKNGTAVTGLGSVGVTTTAATTNATAGNVCANGDEIGLVLSSPSAADGLSVTVYVDCAV